jgi:predicted DNA-binding transcriptional regulator AlpA
VSGRCGDGVPASLGLHVSPVGTVTYAGQVSHQNVFARHPGTNLNSLSPCPQPGRERTMLPPNTESKPSWASDESLIPSRQLRQLLGSCSEMHIWRLLNREKLRPLAFPRPIKINDRNYWRLGAIRRWIEDQEARSRKQATLTAPDMETRHPAAWNVAGDISSFRKSRRVRPVRGNKPRARAGP